MLIEIEEPGRSRWRHVLRGPGEDYGLQASHPLVLLLRPGCAKKRGWGDQPKVHRKRDEQVENDDEDADEHRRGQRAHQRLLFPDEGSNGRPKIAPWSHRPAFSGPVEDNHLHEELQHGFIREEQRLEPSQGWQSQEILTDKLKMT